MEDDFVSKLGIYPKVISLDRVHKFYLSFTLFLFLFIYLFIFYFMENGIHVKVMDVPCEHYIYVMMHHLKYNNVSVCDALQ
jgi:hypothetical protein